MFDIMVALHHSHLAKLSQHARNYCARRVVEKEVPLRAKTSECGRESVSVVICVNQNSETLYFDMPQYAKCFFASFNGKIMQNVLPMIFANSFS